MSHDDSTETSALWGTAGEEWSPGHRMPDVSYAGYRRGEELIPAVNAVADVTDYGAVGDGEVDDTDAFLAAIDDVDAGAIRVPAGTYRVTDVLRIESSDLVLRGEGPESTRLYFPTPLNDVEPDWGMTAHGTRTSNYSWSGGFVSVEGEYRSEELTHIVGPASRGDRELRVAADHGIEGGARVELFQSDTDEQTLCRYLYGGDPGDVSDIDESATVSQVVDVTVVKDDAIRFDRPLRFDVRSEWNPLVRRFDPTVTEVGIENLGFEFPDVPYEGHFSERGYNPLAFSDVAHCWARNLRVRNMDSGLMISGRFCTIEEINFDSERSPDESGRIGHHGIYLQDDDNQYLDFDYEVEFVHDVSVSHCAGNVISNGRGVNLCLDHHRWIPYANVFTDIDVGEGARVWESSGGRQRGRHCARWGTFWNIRSETPVSPPPDDWGGSPLNVVGIPPTDEEFRTDPDVETWWEPIDPERLDPPNIHAAQLERRLDD